jgi:transposase
VSRTGFEGDGVSRVTRSLQRGYFRYPGRKRLDDRAALQGILFVLHTGIEWRHLPSELGFGSNSTCYRRLDEWQKAGVWERLHALLLSELRAAGEIEWSRVVVDSSHVQAKTQLIPLVERIPPRLPAAAAQRVTADSGYDRQGRLGSRAPVC